MKKVSKVVQNDFARPCRHLKNPSGGTPTNKDLPRAEVGPKSHNPARWVGHRETSLAEKLVFFFAGQFWLTVLCKLGSDWQPATQKKDG